MDTISLTRKEGLILQAYQLAEMQTWVERWLPEEACGLMAGCGRRITQVFLIENQLHSPVRFQMEPAAQLSAFLKIDKAGGELAGIFHSHPAGPAHPSPTDLAEYFYPGAISVIWYPIFAGWQASGFWIEDGTALEVPLIIQPNLED